MDKSKLGSTAVSKDLGATKTNGTGTNGQFNKSVTGGSTMGSRTMKK